MPDSVVNVSAASSIAFPVPTVYFARAGALELSGRILSGEPRSETSQERVGCGLPRDPPSTTACPALPRAGDDPVFLVGEALSAQGSSKKAGSRRFWPKKAYYPRGPGVQPGKIDFYTISSTYALPFSRTIPVRTPQSASRTEVSRPLCHGRAPLSPGRTAKMKIANQAAAAWRLTAGSAAHATVRLFAGPCSH